MGRDEHRLPQPCHYSLRCRTHFFKGGCEKSLRILSHETSGIGIRGGGGSGRIQGGMNQGTVGYALGLGRLDSAHFPQCFIGLDLAVRHPASLDRIAVPLLHWTPSPASLDWTWPCRAEGVGNTQRVAGSGAAVNKRYRGKRLHFDVCPFD
jgi:hypothetical protein